MNYEQSEENYDYDQNNDYSQYIQVQKIPYQILLYNKILPQLQRAISQIVQLTYLQLGWSLLLLQYFKWNSDILKDRYYTDPQGYQKIIGYSTAYPKPFPLNLIPNVTCDICSKEQTTIATNICGQGACSQCWLQHFNCKLQYCGPFISCIQGCKVPILNETVYHILSWISTVQSSKFLFRYEKKLCEQFSCNNRSFQFCTGVECNNFIKVPQCMRQVNGDVQTVQCTCGTVFCFRCRSEDHSPCTCDQRKKWVEQVLKEEADAKWISLNAKICPWCRKAVERNEGCNYMMCKCGKSFCYMCSEAWEPAHTDHWKCHKKRESHDTVSVAKKALENLNDCASRYLINQASAKYFRENCKPFQIRKTLHKILKIPMNDSQFLEESFKFVGECCDRSKWIYAYKYEMRESKKEFLQMFELRLGDCEKYRQNLKAKLSQNLMTFINDIVMFQQKGTLNYEAASYQFRQLKKQIVNYQALTKKNQNIFIQSLKQNNQQEMSIQKKKSSQKTQTKLIQPQKQKKKEGLMDKSIQQKMLRKSKSKPKGQKK